MTGLSSTLRERFWRYTEQRDESACWAWTGDLDRFGYGRIYAGASMKSQLAHRISWILLRGDIPPGLFVCHHCDNNPCVNPTHLFLGTTTDNIRDARDKGRLHAQRVTACPMGHPYDDVNTYVGPQGKRLCRACAAIKRVAWERAHPERKARRLREAVAKAARQIELGIKGDRHEATN